MDLADSLGDNPAMADFDQDREHFTQTHDTVVGQVARRIVGQTGVVEQVLCCLLAGGHGLLEGLPGLAKTLIVRTLAETLHLDFTRIQFTPDLMPTDITGSDILVTEADGRQVISYRRGPIFAHLVLADEINRATPKTQSALLEAMQERTVSAGGQTRALPTPGAVLATQNPIEMEGTFPLPEAQLDRFLLKINVSRPSPADLETILQQTTGPSPNPVQPVAGGEDILRMQRTVRAVACASHLLRYIARLIEATHPQSDLAPDLVRRYVRYGSSPRGAQAVLLAAKVAALRAGRPHVAAEDVRAVARSALRHRLVLNFDARADNRQPDAIVDDALQTIDANTP